MRSFIKARKQLLFFLLPIAAMILLSGLPNNFLTEQKRYPRVRTAFAEKEQIIHQYFTKAGIDDPPGTLFIRAFKLEKKLEVWSKSSKVDSFKLIKTYDICALSGTLGPKRQRGDLQIPEGFYHINHFNPYSNFYLSLKINYPNASDRKLGKKGRLGGDIFIHGDCVTIGCLPITDEKIKELYIMCVLAKNGGQAEIPPRSQA